MRTDHACNPVEAGRMLGLTSEEVFDALFVTRELRGTRDGDGEIWITVDELERFRRARSEMR